MKNYTKHAIKGVSIIFIISIISAFFGYLIRFLLARNLTLEQFGLFYSIFSFLSLITLFKTLGFDRSLIKFIPELISKKRINLIKTSIFFVIAIQIITNLIAIVLIYLFSRYLSINFFHNSQADYLLRLMAIAFFIDGFVVILKFSMQGFQRMALFSLLDLFRMLILLLIIFIGLNMGIGLYAPIIAYILTPAILLLIFGFIFLKYVYPDFIKTNLVRDNNLFKKISKYSLFIMITSSGVMVLGHTDSLLLTYFKGVAAVGLYSVALPTAKLLLYFPNAFGSILLPVTSELWTKKEDYLLKYGVESLYKYSMIIVVPMGLIMLTYSEIIITLLFSKDYISAVFALKILVVGMLFATLHAIHSNFFQGIGKPQIHSKIIIFGAIFNLIGNIILIPFYGIYGAAITTSFVYFVMVVVGLYNIKKFINLNFPFKDWGKILFSGVILVIIINFLRGILKINIIIEIIIVLLISGIVYSGLLFLLGLLNIKELKKIITRFKN
tara:strand:- start:1251 stop:2741 length:1491 start_codon:yes stop_codon:yes gene_type:complete